MSDSTGVGQAVISRRDAIVGALALAAGTLLASAPQQAFAADGETVTTGGTFNPVNPTIFYQTAGASSATICAQDGPVCYGLHAAVMEPGGVGSAGVRGVASGPGQYGVHGSSSGDGGAAVKAASTGSIGVDASDDNGGIAVRAFSTGVALDIIGQTWFSRSGKGYISKNHSSATVTVPSGVGMASLILVTLQGSAGAGRYVTYAKRQSSGTQFKVCLNKAAAGKVYFAWFIIS